MKPSILIASSERLEQISRILHFWNLWWSRPKISISGGCGYKTIGSCFPYHIRDSLLFNNAGYIKSGFFAETPLKAQLDNHNCNATSVVQITHHYLSEMRKKGLKGCITFTSSPAGLMPCPTSLMYGSTKCYLTLFAMSLAAEIRADGIDVCVVHPSPVQSNFYKNTPKLGAVEFFKSTATGPETIVNALFGAIGRTVVRDQGYYPAVVKLLLKIVDVNLLADITAMTASNLDDYKNLKAMKAEKKDDLPTAEVSAAAKKVE